MAVEKDGVPASGWAYTPDKTETSTWKLNISDATHVSGAVAALGKGFRGNKVQIPEDDLPAVKRKVRAAYKKFHPDLDMPEILKASEMIDMFSSFIDKFFSKASDEQVVEELDEEMVSYEVVYEPMVKDAHGEWMTEATIADACDNFNHYLEKGVVNANLFHLKETDAFTIESTWVQKEFDVKVIQTGEVIKAGTWVAKLKYNDETLWDLKKQGILGGVSIGGRGVVNQKTGEITNVTFDGEDN
jgi:hypothetical protein